MENNNYFKGTYNDFMYNSYLSLKRNIKLNKRQLQSIQQYKDTAEYEKEAQSLNSSISSQHAELQNKESVSDTFKFDEGKDITKYKNNALSMADSYIKDGDTDGDGKLSRDEYIAMQKSRMEKLNTETNGKMDGAKWDNATHSEAYGNVFDAINSQRSTDGKTEYLDNKELATYFSYTDASDGKMDGKINYNTASAMDERLADTSSEKRNLATSNIKDWYNNMFGQN